MKTQEPKIDCEPIPLMLATTSQFSIVSVTLDFLDLQQIISIAEIALAHHLNTVLFRTAIVKAFLGKYLNRVDRTVFFTFYEDLDFHSIEKNNIHILTQQHHSSIAKAYRNYAALLQAVQHHTQYLTTQPDFKNLFEQLFLEPDLPLPKLKRESIGMYCQTGFQEYLSLIKFPIEDQELWVPQPLEELREQLTEQLAQLNQKVAYNEGSQEQIKRKIKQIRLCGYKVNQENWRGYLIEGFKTHNLIVLMLAFCAEMVATFKEIVSSIADPFMRFTEFALRSSIYRNIILAVEEKFSFLFSNYTEFYLEAFQPPPQYPPLNFWRPALSIWVQQMKCFHSSNEKVYNYVTSKLRESNLKQLLIAKTQKLPSCYSDLKREIDLETFSLQKKNSLYYENGHQLEMQTLFEENQDMYEALAKDYFQYMIDISMNEYNVHWCGHSGHVILSYPLFSSFVSQILNESSKFYHFIKKIVDYSVPREIKLSILKEIIKDDLLFSEQRLFKPAVIVKITEMINKQIKEQVECLPEFAVFSEQGYIKNKISMDFQEKDGILAYFNKKNGINQDCPSNLSFFYNIQNEDINPVFLKEKDNQMEEEEDLERYMSDESEEEERFMKL